MAPRRALVTGARDIIDGHPACVASIVEANEVAAAGGGAAAEAEGEEGVAAPPPPWGQTDDGVGGGGEGAQLVETSS